MARQLGRLAAAAIVLSLTACSPGHANTDVAVTITGGHDTDPRDSGRPVALVAGALGVPAEVFRTAFLGVTPAAAGEQPDAAQVSLNKAALLRVLENYGVTNEQLDRASDHYRYVPGSGATWPTRTASAVASVENGRVVSIRVVDGGAGYSSPPTVTVAGRTATATLSFSTDLDRNGTVASIALS